MRLLLALIHIHCCAGLRYLILRHGQTNHNAAGIIQGSSDVSRLTDKGEAQARASGAAIAQLDDEIARTYLSPLTRARQTFALLLESRELPAATTLDDLREIDLHSWQGRDKTQLKLEQPAAWRAWQADPLALVVDGHKPIVDLWARARTSVWPAVRSDAAADGATLLVCHGSLGQALLCTSLGLDETAWRRHEFPNCGLAEVEWPCDAPRATRWRWRLPEETEWRTE